MKLGDIVKALRALNGWGTPEVARRASEHGERVAYQKIQQLEAKPDTSPGYLPQLAAAFEKSIDDLISWQPGMPHLGPNTPVSRSDATPSDAHHIAVRRVRIEGAVEMDENGFWTVGSDEAKETSYPTEDPDAYAIRVTSQRFKPVVSIPQCILVSPRSTLEAGRHVVITTLDGRKTLRTFLSHQFGVWNLASVTDANDYFDMPDEMVAKVEMVIAYMWT